MPRSMTFSEFPLDHFYNSVIHNIICLSTEKVNEAMQNFNEESQTTTITDKYYIYTIQVFNNRLVTVTLESLNNSLIKYPKVHAHINGNNLTYFIKI